jgi:hypothetical protein
MGLCLETRKGHCTPGRRAHEARKLIPPRRWDPGVGVQRQSAED